MSPRSNQNQHLISGQIQKSTRPWWALNVNPLYDHMILVNGSLNMAAVNQTSYGCLIWKVCAVSKTAKLGISWMAAMLRDVVVVRRLRRRHWAHTPVIHAASHFYHEKRVKLVSISMHACDPVPIVMGLRSANKKNKRKADVLIRWLFFKTNTIMVWNLLRIIVSMLGAEVCQASKVVF